MSLFRKITETVSKGVTTATEKAQQTVEISRLHSQITGKRKEIDRLFAEIGQAVFDAYTEKDLSLAEDKVIPTCEEIAAIQHEIDAVDERIKMLRNEKDCVCGRRLAYDTRFCPSCGHPFPEPEPEPPAPEDREAPAVPDLTAETPGFAEIAYSPEAANWTEVGHTQPSYRTDAELPGERQEEIPAHCPSCGTTVNPSARFCPSCGIPLE